MAQEISKTEINKGDEIVTQYGNVYEVEMVYDNMIYVYGSQNVIHVSNVVEVYHQGNAR